MYTDDNLKICDSDYSFLIDIYDDIGSEVSEIYSSFANCINLIKDCALNGYEAKENLDSLSKSLQSIINGFADIIEVKTLCENYMTDIEEKDEYLYLGNCETR